VRFDEGAAVGYRWYEHKGLDPLFAFGEGLSYTSFAREALSAQQEAGELHVRFRMRNTGARAGKDVALIFVAPAAGGWEAPRRLGAFTKQELAPGATQEVDPRLLATWDSEQHGFHIAAGEYQITLARSARAADEKVTLSLPERRLPAGAGVAKEPVRH
jgi:beta-glucosidase